MPVVGHILSSCTPYVLFQIFAEAACDLHPRYAARLGHLLSLYPEARVIYIYRDPYAVYLSTLRMHEQLHQVLALQDYDPGYDIG